MGRIFAGGILGLLGFGWGSDLNLSFLGRFWGYGGVDSGGFILRKRKFLVGGGGGLGIWNTISFLLRLFLYVKL